jgi:hypothetical protein
MSSSLPLQVAETIQTASINRAPSPSHDLNPSTAASKKQPVTLEPRVPASDSSLDKYAYDEEDAIDLEDEDDIPYSVLKPTPRRQSFGPLPDLRFEQSYLASIANADTRWKVLLITVRDQVFYTPFIYLIHVLFLIDGVGIHAVNARHDMVPSVTWLAVLEPQHKTEWEWCRNKDTEMVVYREQLAVEGEFEERGE